MADYPISRRTALALLGVGLSQTIAPRSASAAAARGRSYAAMQLEPEANDWRPLWIAAGSKTGPALTAAGWIWHADPDPVHTAPVGLRYFRRSVMLPVGRTVKSAQITIKADNEYVLYVNGVRVGEGDDFHVPGRYDVASALAGHAAVTIAVEATNAGDTPNPAGMVAAFHVEFADGEPLDIVTDGTWRSSDKETAGWERPDFDDAGWTAAVRLGDYGMAPWGSAESRATDVYAAFRGTFLLEKATEVTLDIFGAHWFQVQIDGEYLTEGPYRFRADHPEYEARTAKLAAGKHVVAATVRDEGVATRMLRGDVIPPFFLCRAHGDGNLLPIAWKATRLPGYIASGQRVNPQFGWIEWVDTRRNPEGWSGRDFDDSAWAAPTAVDFPTMVAIQPVRMAAIQQIAVTPRLIEEGTLTGPFERGHHPEWQSDDDLSWYYRSLYPPAHPTGVWRRYDLGQIRLGRPEFTLDVPSGTIIEIAYSEELRDGRVTPFIPLSAGLSRNLDHFVARGGRQTFAPIAPKGGRYLEIHVAADPAAVHFHDVAYTHRTYFGDPVGTFDCGDTRLNAIWGLGINTLRACAEDAVIDNPTRERGQWTGDALPSLHIAAVGFNDLHIARRALEQSAYCARADGLVAGLCPGGGSYLSTYAAQWFSAVIEYYDLTGDRSPVDALYPYAERNLAAFASAIGPNGVRDSLGWAFIDWGYPGTPGTDSDIALNLHALLGIRSMRRWTQLLRKDIAACDQVATAIQSAANSWLAPRIGADHWVEIGYHRTALALAADLVPAAKKPAAVAYLKQHILSCFPNDPTAPRLYNPDVHSTRLITPYFAHYAFPVLYEAGEVDFVLDQYRACWGWTLDQGLTTQPEVFDLGWSHCHVWAASPTAQMSKYLLGLQPNFGKGVGHFELTLNPGNLAQASGAVPFPNGEGAVLVHWSREAADAVRMQLTTPRPVYLHEPGEASPFLAVAKTVEVRFVWNGGRWRAG